MTLPLIALALAVATYFILRRWANYELRLLGIDSGGLIAADDSRLGIATLRSARLGLVGRPDQIVRDGRAYIPIEQKPTARRLYASHVMQVAAQCVLVNEVYGVRPPFGVVVLRGGRAERVAFTPQLERRVLETMGAMRSVLNTRSGPGPQWIAAKCPNCGYHDLCWGQESSG
jgi:CRISPR-associated exonuclease Cas4